MKSPRTIENNDTSSDNDKPKTNMILIPVSFHSIPHPIGMASDVHNPLHTCTDNWLKKFLSQLYGEPESEIFIPNTL